MSHGQDRGPGLAPTCHLCPIHTVESMGHFSVAEVPLLMELSESFHPGPSVLEQDPALAELTTYLCPPIILQRLVFPPLQYWRISRCTRTSSVHSCFPEYSSSVPAREHPQVNGYPAATCPGRVSLPVNSELLEPAKVLCSMLTLILPAVKQMEMCYFILVQGFKGFYPILLLIP